MMKDLKAHVKYSIVLWALSYNVPAPVKYVQKQKIHNKKLLSYSLMKCIPEALSAFQS